MYYICHKWKENMKQELKNSYESPQVEMIEVMVEQGFASSNAAGNTNPFGEQNGVW